MDYGAHLPLMALDGRPWTLDRLLEYAHTAEGAWKTDSKKLASPDPECRDP